MSARRVRVALAVSAILGGLVSGGTAAASPRASALHPATSSVPAASSVVPARARAGVNRALTRDGASTAFPALRGTEITAHGGRSNDEFGSSVAISGNTIVVGADAGANSGRGEVYVFERPPSGWAHVRQVATLTASDGRADDGFGSGVALSGTTIVVSAPYHQVGSNPAQGELYVFVRPAAGWSGMAHETAQLTAGDGADSDNLGYEGVAISGGTVVAGAGAHEVGTNLNQGAVYVFVRPTAGWSGPQEQSAELTASDGAADDFFGYGEVGVSGNTVVASSGYHQVATFAAQGAVYVFVRPPSGWTGVPQQTAELTASDGAASDFLGYKSVAISGATVVAGAANHSVRSRDNQGAAYVFVRPAAGWSATQHEAAELVAKHGAADDLLGYAGVAVSGSTVAVDAASLTVRGAVNRGATYLFTAPDGGWSGTLASMTGKVATDGAASDYLGYSATAIAGTTLVVGSDGHQVGSQVDRGAVYVFAPPPPSLTALSESRPSWRTGTRRPSLNPARPPTGGTRFGFSLSQPATVTLRFVRHAHGQIHSAGSLRVAAPKGHNRLYFFGRLAGGRSLPDGKYTVSFVAANTHGAAPRQRLHFTVRGH